MLPTSRFIAFGVIAAIALAAPAAAAAQDTAARHPRWEFLVSSGKLVPTGAQRASLRAGDHANPFVAGGVGARGYRANGVATTARNNAAAYVGAGTELGARRVRIRLEARDYVSGFRELNRGGVRVAHNDVVVMAGLRLVEP